MIDLRSRLTPRLTLDRPIVSANMDTVTRAPMATVMAEEGGLGIIDRGFRPGDIEPQVKEVQIVKRTQHGVIRDPYTIAPDATVAEAAAAMLRSRVGTLVVVDGSRKLMGLLTERDLRFLTDSTARVAERMTPRDRLVLHEGELPLAEAERIMVDRKVKKLPLVARDGTLIGLITSRDLAPAAAAAVRDARRSGPPPGRRGDRRPTATTSSARRSCCGRARTCSSSTSPTGTRRSWSGRSTASARRFPDADVIAGNVATAEGARFLVERGASAVKVGIGPGGGCTTRITTSFGVPQLQAIVACREAVGGDRAPHRGRWHPAARQHLRGAALRRRYGDARQRLRRHARVARRDRAEVCAAARVAAAVKVPFKVLRGMASIEAIKDRARRRGRGRD